MVLQPLLLSAVPSGVLNMTADFAPLLVSMWVVLGLSVLGLAVALALQDTREAKRTAKQVTELEPSFPKAA
jgi:hypothetical protein